MIRRWISGAAIAAALGATAGACAGAVIASSLLGLNRIQTDVMSVLVLCTLFAVLYGIVGAAVGVAIVTLRWPMQNHERVSKWIALTMLGGLVCTTVHAVWRNASDRRPPSLEIPPILPGTPPLLLIGIDGLDWKITERLLAEGKLPNLARLRQRGFAAPLKTIEPTLSPVIWNTIASGVRPEVHGVHGFDAYRVRGVDASFSRLIANVGMWRMLEALRVLGLAERVPIGAESCRVPRVWDVVGAGGRRVFISNWWATWPADVVHGWLVTDRFYYFPGLPIKDASNIAEVGTVCPAETLADLAGLRLAPSALTREEVRQYVDLSDADLDALDGGARSSRMIESELRFLISMDATYRRVVSRILAHEAPPQFSAVYLRGLDIISHAALRYSDFGELSLQVTPEEVRKYGQAVRRYYKATDEIIGEWVALAGLDATVIVVSDHGFEQSEDGEWGHDHAPDGVIFGAGGLVREGGDARGATIFDVTPTVLYLAGAPVARDLPGQVLESIVDPDHLRSLPVQFVATFGRHVAQAGKALGAHDEEQLRRLRAIGYIK